MIPRRPDALAALGNTPASSPSAWPSVAWPRAPGRCGAARAVAAGRAWGAIGAGAGRSVVTTLLLAAPLLLTAGCEPEEEARPPKPAHVTGIEPFDPWALDRLERDTPSALLAFSVAALDKSGAHLRPDAVHIDAIVQGPLSRTGVTLGLPAAPATAAIGLSLPPGAVLAGLSVGEGEAREEAHAIDVSQTPRPTAAGATPWRIPLPAGARVVRVEWDRYLSGAEGLWLARHAVDPELAKAGAPLPPLTLDVEVSAVGAVAFEGEADSASRSAGGGRAKLKRDAPSPAGWTLLRITPAPAGATKVHHGRLGDEHLFVIALRPPRPAEAEAALDRDLVIAFDTAGDAARRRRLGLLVEGLAAKMGPQAHLAVVWGGPQPHVCAPATAGASPATLASRCLAQLPTPAGGTDLGALLEAAAAVAAATDRRTEILLISDGRPTLGALSTGALKARLAKAVGEARVTLTPVAVGPAPDLALLAALAGGDAARVIETPPALGADLLLAKVVSALDGRAAEVAVKMVKGDIANLVLDYPRPATPGEPILIAGRLVDDAATVAVEGTYAGATFKEDVLVQRGDAADSPLVPAFWARGAAARLLGDGEPNAALVKRLTAARVATQHLTLGFPQAGLPTGVKSAATIREQLAARREPATFFSGPTLVAPQPPDAPPAVAVAVVPRPLDPGGVAVAKAVAKALDGRAAAFGRCFAQAFRGAEAPPWLAMRMRLTVDPKGVLSSVAAVERLTPGGRLARCAAAVITAAPFDVGPLEASARVEVALSFAGPLADQDSPDRWWSEALAAEIASLEADQEAAGLGRLARAYALAGKPAQVGKLWRQLTKAVGEEPAADGQRLLFFAAAEVRERLTPEFQMLATSALQAGGEVSELAGYLLLEHLIDTEAWTAALNTFKERAVRGAAGGRLLARIHRLGRPDVATSLLDAWLTLVKDASLRSALLEAAGPVAASRWQARYDTATAALASGDRAVSVQRELLRAARELDRCAEASALVLTPCGAKSDEGCVDVALLCPGEASRELPERASDETLASLRRADPGGPWPVRLITEGLDERVDPTTLTATAAALARDGGRLDLACAAMAQAAALGVEGRPALAAYGALRAHDEGLDRPLRRCLVGAVAALPTRVDLAIVVTWDDPSADVDLAVEEPTGRLVSADVASEGQGGQLLVTAAGSFGPEIYGLGEASPGDYVVTALLRSGEAPCAVNATFVLNAGTERERRIERSVTLTPGGARASAQLAVVQPAGEATP